MKIYEIEPAHQFVNAVDIKISHEVNFVNWDF